MLPVPGLRRIDMLDPRTHLPVGIATERPDFAHPAEEEGPRLAGIAADYNGRCKEAVVAVSLHAHTAEVLTDESPLELAP